MHAAVTHFDYFVFAVVVAITPINLGACSTSTRRSVKAVTNSCCSWNHIVYLASMMTVTALCLVVVLPANKELIHVNFASLVLNNDMFENVNPYDVL